MKTLLLWGLLCCSLAAVQASNWSVHIENKMQPEAFAKRFEKHLRQRLDESDFFVVDGGRTMGAPDTELHLDLRYPLRAFPREAGLYVKVSGLPSGTRYLYYAHPSLRDGDLSIQQSRRLTEKVSADLLQTLKGSIESSSTLQVGYYTNKRRIDIEPPLNIELIGPRIVSSPGPPPNLKTLQKLERETSIAEEALQRREGPTTEPLPEPRKKAQQREQLLQTLDENWKPEVRSAAYLELSELYEEEGLKEDALVFAEAAYKESGDLDARRQWTDLQGFDALPLQRLRRHNEDKGATIWIRNLLQHDTNILQESVDSTTASDTDSWLIYNGLDFSQKWRGDWRGWTHRTRLNAFNEFYNEAKELDVLGAQLSHELSHLVETKGTQFLFAAGGGYYYYINRGDALLKGFEGDLSLSLMKSVNDMFGLSLRWREKAYGETFYSKAERDGNIYRLEGSWQHHFSKDYVAVGRIGLTEDEVGDDTLSYSAWSIDGRYSMPCPWLFFHTMSAEAGYEFREYKAPEFGRTHREDAQFEFGLDVEASPFETHVFKVGYLYTENESKRSINAYRRQQFRFGYDIRF